MFSSLSWNFTLYEWEDNRRSSIQWTKSVRQRNIFPNDFQLSNTGMTISTKLLIVNRLVRSLFRISRSQLPPSDQLNLLVLEHKQTFRCRRLLAAGGGVEQAAGVWLMFRGFDDGRHEDLMASLSRCWSNHVFLGFEMSGYSTEKGNLYLISNGTKMEIQCAVVSKN